jgi:hypothetical protein
MGTPQEEDDWLKRLRDEARELEIKRTKLSAYLNNGAPGSNPMQVKLMNEQAEAMEHYFTVLAKRIAYVALTGGH